MAVIGTAQVVIRAITTGLQKDIESGLKKGIADADVDKAGEDSGEKLAKGMGRGIRRHGKEIDNPLNEQLAKSGKSAGDRLIDAVFGRFSDDAEIQKRTKAFSKKLQKSLTSIFKGFNIPPIAWLGILAVPALGGAVKIISNYVIGIVGQLGFLTTAAIATGVAVGGALAGLGTAILPLFILLKRNTPELDAFKAQMTEIGKSFEGLARSVQRVVLPAFSEFAGLLTDELMPILAPLSVRSAASAANFLKLAGGVLTSSENFKSLSVFAESSSRIFDTLLRIVARLLDTLIPLLEAAAPLAEAFALSVENLVKNFQEFIRQSSRSGKLAATLKLWYDRAVQVGNSLGDIAVAIFNILQIGGASAAPFFDRLNEITQRWRDFTTSATGQSQIKRVFDEAMPVMHEVNLLIRDIVKALIEPTLKGDTSNIIGFLRTMRTVMLPVIIELAQALSGGLADTMTKFAESLAKFLDQAARSGVLFTFFTVLGDLLDILSQLLALPGMGPFIATLFALAAGLKALNIATLGFSSKALAGIVTFLLNITGITPALSAASAALSGGGGIAGALGALAPLAPVAGVVLAIAAALAAFVLVFKNWDTIQGWIDKLPRPLELAARAFLILNAPIYALVAVLKNKDEIFAFFRDLPGKILDFVTAIPEALGKLPGIIGDALSGLGGIIGEKVSSAFSDVTSWFGDMAGKVGSALADFGTWVFDGVVAGLKAAPGIATEFFEWVKTSIEEGAPKLAHFLGELPFKMVEWVITGIGAVLVIGTQIILKIIEGLASALPQIITWFVQLPIKLNTLALQIAAKLIPFGFRLIVGIITGFISAIPDILEFFLVTMPNAILGAGITLITKIVPMGFNIVVGLVTGFFQALPSIIQFFVVDLPNAIFGALLAAATWLLGVGLSVLEGFLQGMNDGTGGLIEFLGGLPGKIIEWLSDVSETLLDSGRKLLGGFFNGVKEVVEDVKAWFRALPGVITTALPAMGEVLLSAGKALVNGFKDGIIEAAKDIAGFFKRNTIDKIVEFLPGSPAKRGPLSGRHSPFLRGVSLATDFQRGIASAAVSGLPLARSVQVPTVPTAAATRAVPATATNGSLLHIENATFIEPTDLDAFLGTIRFAYNMAGGR